MALRQEFLKSCRKLLREDQTMPGDAAEKARRYIFAPRAAGGCRRWFEPGLGSFQPLPSGIFTRHPHSAPPSHLRFLRLLCAILVSVSSPRRPQFPNFEKNISFLVNGSN